MKFRTCLFTLISCLAAHSSFAAWPAQVEPDVIAQAGKLKRLPVIVFLKRQHAAEASAAVADAYRARVQDLRSEMTAAVRKSMQRPSMPPAEERRLIANGLPAASPTVIWLTRQMDRLRQQMSDEVFAQARSSAFWDFQILESRLRSLGAAVSGRSYSVSAVSATVPSSALPAMQADPEIRVIALNHKTYKELNVSGPSLGATAFWTVGIAGNPYDVGVLDSGVYQAHPGFSTIRFESNNGTTDPDGHGTHVAGILASGVSGRRGMAYGLDTMSVATATGDNEAADMVNMDFLMGQVQERGELVNYSFGSGIADDTDYSGYDQYFDAVCDTFDIGISKSTGNNDHTLPTRITHPAPAYNLLACASVNDQNTINRSDDRISIFSSAGPTVSGRKKPDIAAPGDDIESLANFGAGFASLSGTSMAAPHVGGGLLLLLAAGSPSPLAAKATLLNTADAMDGKGTQTTNDDVFVSGSYWDPWYGWGYLNLSTAALHVGDVFDAFLPAPGNVDRTVKLYKGEMFQDEKATLTWNRHVAYSGPSYPSIVRSLSNLELFAYSLNGSQLASSTSSIDNVEQLSVPLPGTTVLKVSTNGLFDPALLQERFALATQENFVEAAGPVASSTWFKLPSANYLAPFPVTVTITNTGDLPIVTPTATLTNCTVVSGQNPRTLATIAPGESLPVTWTVRRTINIGNVRATLTLTSESFGESWRWVSTDPSPL